MVKIGIIGGSGLYELDELENIEEIDVNTPFGKPSDKYIKGELFGKTLIFLPRHGRGHRIPPHKLNFRANIYGFKILGVERIISISAVGSMKEDIKPGDMVVVSQFIDRTWGRDSTFFEDGIVAHISFADPVCPELSEILYEASKKVVKTTHKNATYLCINGPQFSTKAESYLYRAWGVDVIGMTNVNEAKLAREAEICYSTLALATDYDCWKEDNIVNVEEVVKTLLKNVENAKKIIVEAVKMIDEKRNCHCKDALKFAIMTNPSLIPEETKLKLKPIIQKYIK